MSPAIVVVDEQGTRARVQADARGFRAEDRRIPRGRLVKTMGDGLLVEFQSVVDAMLRRRSATRQGKTRCRTGTEHELAIDLSPS